jgi:hypothetical protein
MLFFVFCFSQENDIDRFFLLCWLLFSCFLFSIEFHFFSIQFFSTSRTDGTNGGDPSAEIDKIVDEIYHESTTANNKNTSNNTSSL